MLQISARGNFTSLKTTLLGGVSSYGDYVKGEPLAIVICFNEADRNPACEPFDCACAAMNIWLCAEGLAP